MVAEAEAAEEAEEASATTTMVEEVVATTMEAEVVETTTMDTRTTSIRGTINTLSHISNNKCLLQFHCLIQHPDRCLTFKTTTWTTMQIKLVTILTVANGATKGNTGCDRPNLVQGIPMRTQVHWTIQAIEATLIPMLMVYEISQSTAEI